MQVLFEHRPDVLRVAGNMHFFQRRPEVTQNPVLIGETEVDGKGAHIYGSVLKEGGRYRMWYLATPTPRPKRDTPLVAYAESDDGVTWRRPNLGLVEWNGSRKNNLTNLGMHCPTIAIDPDAPPERRYFGAGCIDARYIGYASGAQPPTGGAYFTAHSADGLSWTLDSVEPRWASADCIYSAYHPTRRCLQALMKVGKRYGGMGRRAWWETARRDGEWEPRRMALIPDDFDDVAAMARGYASGDYYGIGLLPAAQSTVGFVQAFRHRLPRNVHPSGSEQGRYGPIDLTLAYQHDDGHCWLHTPGRPDWMAAHEVPWGGAVIYCACNVTEADNEQRLYIGASPHSHGVKAPDGGRGGGIGYAHWPKWRLFGFHADPEGELEIELGELDQPCELLLNYEALTGGAIHVQLHTLAPFARLQETEPVEQRRYDDAVALTGDALQAPAAWSGGTVIHPTPGRRTVARLSMQRAKVYAFELRPVQR